MRRISVLFVCLLAGLIVWVIALGRTHAEEEADKSAVNDFGDGIVVLTVDRTSGIEGRRSSNTLTNARIAEMGGRFFVRGKVYVSPQVPESQSSQGVDAAFAWEDVASFYVFTEDQLEKYIAARREEE